MTAPESDPHHRLSSLGSKLIRSRLVLSGAVLLGIAACFFVGRRIYYRMIQPAPAWAVATPKSERVVCKESLTISLWADETLVNNPTSLSIDARGRVWVSEAVNYREWTNHHQEAGQAFQPAGDQIVILEDTDQDGRADSRQVFAQDPDLIAPTGVCVLGNRVFVSCSPSIFVFTDENGDDRADRKEIFLTGFGGRDHDHGVHGITPGPDGRLYFSVGNAGPHVVTDKSGWTLRSGSHYQSAQGTSGGTMDIAPLNSGGLVSDDGRVYVGGLVLSVKPDGTNLRVHSHNSRNPYGTCIDSFGDVWQTDNDDTTSCRMTWLMSGANTGFASADGVRAWQADQRPGQPLSRAHWHQDDPGVVPAGDIYGVGAPTGLMRCEGDSLGTGLQGAVLACDAGLGAVFAFHPVVEGAGFGFRRTKLIWAESQSDGNHPRPDGLALTWFRPTDIAAAPSGELFVSDWYDSYVGAHRVNDTAAGGRIYVVRSQRATRDGEVKTSSAGATGLDAELAAMRSETASVRWDARLALETRGEAAIPEVRQWMTSREPHLQARALWVLATLGDEGRREVRSALGHSDPQLRITALRALIAAGESPSDLASLLVGDRSSAVRREAATALRGRSLEVTRPLLVQLAATLDGLDRSAVEAFGLACEGHEESIYPELRLRFGSEPAAWTAGFAALAWRLHPPSALVDLRDRLHDRSLPAEQHQRTLDAIGFVKTRAALQVLETWVSQSPLDESVASEPPVDLREYSRWWASRLSETLGAAADSSIAVGGSVLNVRFLPIANHTVDPQSIDQILSLVGDVTRGRDLFYSQKGTCGACHRALSRGGQIGPDLTQVARKLPPHQLVESILYPSNAILTGYESWAIADKRGRTLSGLLMSVGPEIVLKAADGKLHSVPQSEIEELVRQGTSLMPDSLAKSLSPQDIADIVAFLRETVSPDK